ncbi:hypothetical protein [Atlantibacter sp.]|uniref:hypothetical protein n=1 Tax=Atlantibacter sp. TaxID=1903473 RepID=UPI0028AA9B56|nr:hypothetical protein [Atlantibacter sp.]
MSARFFFCDPGQHAFGGGKGVNVGVRGAANVISATGTRHCLQHNDYSGVS